MFLWLTGIQVIIPVDRTSSQFLKCEDVENNSNDGVIIIQWRVEVFFPFTFSLLDTKVVDGVECRGEKMPANPAVHSWCFSF